MIIKHFLLYARFTGFLALLLLVRPALATQQPILVVGDSISAAYGMSLQQGWVALMAGQIAQTHPEYTVVNASISGETTAGALRRLPALLKEHQPAIVVIELGGNDGLRGYPLKTLRSNLANMAKLARRANAELIIVEMQIPPNYGSRYTSRFRETFGEVAKDYDGVLAPFLLEGVAGDSELMQGDGIHPRAAAQEQLLANFLPTLLEVLP